MFQNKKCFSLGENVVKKTDDWFVMLRNGFQFGNVRFNLQKERLTKDVRYQE